MTVLDELCRSPQLSSAHLHLRRAAPAFAALALLFAIGCGESDDTEDTSSPVGSASATTSATGAAPSVGATGSTTGGETSGAGGSNPAGTSTSTSGGGAAGSQGGMPAVPPNAGATTDDAAAMDDDATADDSAGSASDDTAMADDMMADDTASSVTDDTLTADDMMADDTAMTDDMAIADDMAADDMAMPDDGATDDMAMADDMAMTDDTASDDTATDDGAEPAGFQPCPADETCKILPLGDSITFGLGFDGGYRVELFRLALADGHDITFTGTQQPNGPMMVEGVPFPRNHAGISGQTISQIAGRIPNPDLQEMPHIILVHAGTNDMNGQAQGAEGRLGDLMDKLIMEAPDALIVVSSIIPFGGRVETFNQSVPGMVEERAANGAHIIYVDQYEGFPNGELGDGVHPNQAGYARMAGKWYAAIEQYLP